MTPVRHALFTLAVLAAGCTPTTNVPATTPTIPATTSLVTPGSVITTTTTAATTTTIDRIAEIEAIFQDLERRRLIALYTHDEDSFRQTFSNERYLEESLILLDYDTFIADPSSVEVQIVEVLADSEKCIAALVEIDLSGITEEGGLGITQQVVENVEGIWGNSYTGKGWACDGPHPLS